MAACFRCGENECMHGMRRCHTCCDVCRPIVTHFMAHSIPLQTALRAEVPTNEFLWYISGSSICEPAGIIAENLPKEVAELIVNTHNHEIEAFRAAPVPLPEPQCGQHERDKQMLEAVENSDITYYGPHPCDLCGNGSIVRGSQEQGYGHLRFDYPAIAYPNHNWNEHRCSACPNCGSSELVNLQCSNHVITARRASSQVPFSAPPTP